LNFVWGSAGSSSVPDTPGARESFWGDVNWGYLDTLGKTDMSFPLNLLNIVFSALRSAALGDWSYPGQRYNSATGHFCDWSGRLEQSPTAHSFRTYIINVKKHAQDTSCLMFLPH